VNCRRAEPLSPRDRRVLIAEPLSSEATSWLAERCRVEHCGASQQGFAERLSDADALIVRTYTRVDAHLLESASSLRVVGRAGAGLDNIDLEACSARGITVVHAPDANTQAVVEYVLCLLADALRPRVRLAGPVTMDEWTALRSATVGRRQMNECVLGVLGLGRIGTGVARVARAIGMRVLFNDLRAIPPESFEGAEPVRTSELFAKADVLTIHIDGRPENTGFVGPALVGLLKKDAVLLNTSRGAVLDHAAVAQWLRACPHARALLDVHDPEPPDRGNPLLALPNATLLPHLASRTESAMRAMSWVVRDVWAALGGD